MDPATWIALAVGDLAWAEAERTVGWSRRGSAPTCPGCCRLAAERASRRLAPHAPRDLNDPRPPSATSCPRSAPTSRRWCASRRSAPTRPAPTTCGAPPRPPRSCSGPRASTTCRSCPRAAARPAVVAPQAGAGGCADRAALRPPRRAADRRPRRLGHRPVRADRARRPALRTRRRRRQGRHRRPPGGDPGARRRPAGRRDRARRGRGGGRLADPRGVPRRAPASCWRPTSS